MSSSTAKVSYDMKKKKFFEHVHRQRESHSNIGSRITAKIKKEKLYRLYIKETSAFWMQYDDDDVVGDGIAGDGKWQVRKFGGWMNFLNAVGT